MKIGGAGVGMLRMIDLAPNIFIVAERGRRTFVGCTFPLNTSLRKVKQTPKNFLLSNFENFESEATSIRVERRGTKIFIHCLGKIDEYSPLKELDLQGATEISFNLRQVREMAGDTLKDFLVSLKNIRTLKKIFFDYVPVSLFAQIHSLLAIDSQMIELRSICHTASCASCQTSQNVVLKTLETVGKEVVTGSLVCLSCGKALPA
jgi:hypothetical protein